MAAQPEGPLNFMKLVVDDLEKMTDYYCTVFELHRGLRHTFEDGVAGEPIDEIALKARPDDAWGNFTLLKFVGRDAAKDDESILGFTTTDLEALCARVERAGGSLIGAIKDMPELGLRVAFARDPEGHLSELVEMKT